MLAFKNSKVAKTLREYSALLGVSGGTPFKANAYQRAAETIESMATSIPAFISAGHNLQELPGVGAGIAGVIQEIVSTGKLKQLKSLSSGLDPSLIELAGVPGLNPKRVASIYKKLNIHSLAELRERSLSGEILDRMGPRFDFEVREALSDRPRLLFKRAWELACTMKSFIEQLPGKLAESRDIDFSRDGMETDGIKLSTEAAVYRALELDFVEPELREGRGELVLAESHNLPKLIRQIDLKGDLHMHTVASDGTNTLKEMAEAAKAKGYSYIAITDHSRSLRIANGLSEDRLLRHIEEIDKLNEKLTGITLLKAAEVDILEDGSLVKLRRRA